MRINTDVNTSLRLRAGMAAGLVAALLAVSGCTGGGGKPAEETTATASESSVSPTGAGEGPTQDTRDDDADETDGASASPSGDGAGDGEGDDGEYVPASEDGPAKNVPVPTKPPMMAYDNPEGAKAAAAYFWDTVNYMHETGDDSYLVEMTGEECSTCKAFASATNARYGGGGWLTSTNLRVEGAIVSSNHSTQVGWVVNQLISSNGGEEFWHEGDALVTGQIDPLDQYPWEMRLERIDDDSTWTVSLVTSMRKP
ncbi:MAG: DUF6318 family protein [Micrococcus sp.]|nr:DUF6318 family protein [Micrococcus sp.]